MKGTEALTGRDAARDGGTQCHLFTSFLNPRATNPRPGYILEWEGSSARAISSCGDSESRPSASLDAIAALAACCGTWFVEHSFSYNANPYTPFPGSSSYELPQNAYAPNSYAYDLRTYGYGYPPPAYARPVHLPPWYPCGYSCPVPRYQRGIYRQLSLRQYLDKQLHGPVRVRDIVRNMPELGGQAASQGR